MNKCTDYLKLSTKIVGKKMPIKTVSSFTLFVAILVDNSR